MANTFIQGRRTHPARRWLMLAMLLCAGCMTTQRSDAELTFAVRTAFVNDAELLLIPDLAVTTVGGEVRLTGTVPTAVLQQRAGRLARDVPGVRKVRNDIVVRYVFHEQP